MKPVICIKIGGTAAESEQTLQYLLEDIKALQPGNQFILVHGGGKEVTRISRVFGIEAVFVDGIRQTSPEEMDIVEMVLAGKVNKKIVRAAGRAGLRAAGLSGSDDRLFTGSPVADNSRTGKVGAVSTEILELLLAKSILPVISSVGMDHEGLGLNINADEIARELAEAMKADILIYISDIPGVMIEGKIAEQLCENECKHWIDKGEISRGMVPKVLSSLEGLRRGIRSIIIGDYQARGDLEKFVHHNKGTTLKLS
ncbi:MAG: acetylglutamate kinase [Spirochaetales bacterium]|nr:acetylglutamate kinase [Spirochaetales bacterium]